MTEKGKNQKLLRPSRAKACKTQPKSRRKRPEVNKFDILPERCSKKLRFEFLGGRSVCRWGVHAESSFCDTSRVGATWGPPFPRSTHSKDQILDQCSANCQYFYRFGVWLQRCRKKYIWKKTANPSTGLRKTMNHYLKKKVETLQGPIPPHEP